MTFIKEYYMTKVEPQGALVLVPEPENKFDKLAVAVHCPHEGSTVRIGYLPAKGEKNVELKKFIHNTFSMGGEMYVEMIEYGYINDRFGWGEVMVSDKPLGGGNKKPATEKKPTTGQKPVAVSARTSKNQSNAEVTSSAYLINGKSYRRLTHLLGTYEPDGKDGADRLTKWACDHGSFDAYKSNLDALAEKGTAMHNAIEDWLGGDKSSPVPEGFLNWYEKYSPEVVAVECRVTDDEIMVAGTYDLLCNIIVKGVKMLVAVDWKSSKNVRKKHRLQVGWYAHQADADEGWVVWFGGKQKQGFGCSRIDEETCAKKARQVDLIAELQGLE